MTRSSLLQPPTPIQCLLLLTQPLADGYPHRAVPRPRFLLLTLLSLLLCSVVLLPMNDSLEKASSL